MTSRHVKTSPNFFWKFRSTSHMKDNVRILTNDVRSFSPLVREQPCQLGVLTCLATCCRWKADVKLQGKWKCILQAKLHSLLTWGQSPNRLSSIGTYLKENCFSRYLWPHLEELSITNKLSLPPPSSPGSGFCLLLQTAFTS